MRLKVKRSFKIFNRSEVVITGTEIVVGEMHIHRPRAWDPGRPEYYFYANEEGIKRGLSCSHGDLLRETLKKAGG